MYVIKLHKSWHFWNMRGRIIDWKTQFKCAISINAWFTATLFCSKCLKYDTIKSTIKQLVVSTLWIMQSGCAAFQTVKVSILQNLHVPESAIIDVSFHPGFASNFYREARKRKQIYIFELKLKQRFPALFDFAKRTRPIVWHSTRIR